MKNRLRHSALKISPFETLMGQKPALKYIHVFGIVALVYNEKSMCKVHARAISSVYSGNDDNGLYKVEKL